MSSAAAFAEHDLALAVDRDDPVGDVGEDGEAALLLERDALVELGVRERRRRVRRERGQRVDLLGQPGAGLERVDREDAVDRAFRADQRDAEEGAVTRAEDRIGGDVTVVDLDVVDRDRRARLDDVAEQPAGRRRTGTERRLGPGAGAALHDQLVAHQQPNRAGFGAEQRGRLLHHLVEDGRRVELGREQAARSRQLLRERARGALGLEQVAALERATGRVGEMDGKLEVVVGELAGFGEEDEHEAAASLPRRLDGSREQRARAGPDSECTPLWIEAVVVRYGGRREDPALGRGGRQSPGGVGKPARERPGEVVGQLVRADELERARARHQHGR